MQMESSERGVEESLTLQLLQNCVRESFDSILLKIRTKEYKNAIFQVLKNTITELEGWRDESKKSLTISRFLE